MLAQFIHIHPDNPQEKKIEEVVSCLKNGGLVILPTDTVYGIACDLHNKKAIEKLCLIQKKKMDRLKLSFLFYDLSNISEYVKSLSNPLFKLMKKTLPGPYTYILNANSNIPKLLTPKKKTIGIRIPDNTITQMITKIIGHPILISSLKKEDEEPVYFTDPEEIIEQYSKLVDMVVDGGYGNAEASTVIDCTNDEIEIVREGIGDINHFL